ncbi:metal-dependent hydrolase [Alkalihalobacillus oceani]|uniref:Metal-dependent hydrolase n=1 Tax=Halalkalibacter oceani TaxID=1653776 RepID=A0A9X2IR70_9BACI|nr:metal-dependent hydrolase [Halalkalibacter oceani]MCM3716616.1 metal-dependent hydrolase [Halalkalibacter oceani]
MTASTHQLTGLLFGLAAISLFQLFPPSFGNLTEAGVFFVLVLFGSLLPDMDTPKSRLGAKVPLISYPLFWLFGHRTWSHSLLFVIITAVTGFLVGLVLHFPYYISLGISIGVLSHVIGDYFFDGGVPLFHPLSKRRYKFLITAKTRRPNSIGFSENIVVGILIVLNSWFLMRWLDVETSLFVLING